MSLKSAAEAHIQSYAATFATFIASNSIDNKDSKPPPSSSSSPSPATILSQDMTSHYHYPFVSFVLGKSYTVSTQSQMAQSSVAYLENWVRAGLLRFKLAKSRVEELSPTNAMCWVTWELADGHDGRKGWSWENVYVYRAAAAAATEEEGGAKKEGGGGGFEAVFSDNEILGLIQHAPEILQGLPGLEAS